jgi:hypothetical protein
MMTTRGRPSRSTFYNRSADEPDSGDAIALDRTLRALYTAYEALRDTPTPPALAQFHTPLADLLRTTNWWSSAQQQLAAARAALSEAPSPAATAYDDAAVSALARALSATLLAAVLLRLPYDAWRPDAALLAGRQPANSVQSALTSLASECATILAEIGVYCRLARRAPNSLVTVCQQALVV